MKYLGIYLPKETKDLYIENYKTLVHPVDCSLPGSSIHGILQAKELELGVIARDGRMSRTAPPCREKAASPERVADPVAVLHTDPAGRGLESCPHTLHAFQP